MNKEFDAWWMEITKKSDKWTTLERLAALQAWEHQQQKIEELENTIFFLENPMSL
jgi:hypothetical protein